MVKRQTVWLSTMMVLSLMLIGYYTINGSVKQVSVPTDGTPLDTGTAQMTGSVTTHPAGTANGSKQTQTTPTSSTVATAETQSAEYFAQLSLTHIKGMSQLEDAQQSIINATKSTMQQVAAANQKLQQLQMLAEKENTVKEMLLGDHFKNAAFVADDGVDVTVAVEAAAMTADQAVQVMKITSDQLGVDMNHIVVKHFS